MVTLNSIAENIAFELGEQFNDTLLESIKNDIVEQRALFIRQDIDRNGISVTDYVQTYTVEMEKVEGFLLKSKQPIAKPLRLKNNGSTNFKSITSIDRNTILSYANFNSLKYQTHLPLQNGNTYYSYADNHLFVLNNLKACKLLVESVVADPREIQDCNEPDKFPDDVAFPIGLDMLPKLKEYIGKKYRTTLINDTEIKQEKDV